jgi:predicted aminopeptidase
LLTLLAGCEAGYYLQAARGQFQLMRASESVDTVLADSATSPELRSKLELAGAALAFAEDELLLPANGSYTNYVDLERRYIVWNVFAAPEFLLKPQTWCFPVVGCLAYRGYFHEFAADEFATKLADSGADVFVGGVAAYSTLTRFNDPLLNTMLSMSDQRMVGLLFHELAHQKLYVKGDTQFNESFATLVEREGMMRWIDSRQGLAAVAAYRQDLARHEQVRALIDRPRRELRALYASGQTDIEKRAAKAAILEALQAEYDGLSADWPGPAPFSGWFSGPINNASLAAVSVYEDYVPALHALLQQSSGDLETFYQRSAELAEMELEERRGALLALER